jgi:hypothetical protein
MGLPACLPRRTIYGLIAVHDINLWLPNGIGVLLAGLQVVLRLMYGTRDKAKGPCQPQATAAMPLQQASHLIPTDSAPVSEPEDGCVPVVLAAVRTRAVLLPRCNCITIQPQSHYQQQHHHHHHIAILWLCRPIEHACHAMPCGNIWRFL